MNKFLTLCLCAYFPIIAFAQLPYQDKTLPPEKRAEDLITRLTLEEKVTLMMNASSAIPHLGIKQYDWWNEALHGVARNGTATVFPQAIGMAASFDDILLHRVFEAVSDEARVKHRLALENGPIKRYQGLTMWTPNINIFRDPRWGRGQETYGEDPYLSSIMGVAVIKGLQGNNKDGYDKLHACAKHYAVHSGPEWNRHSFNAENISPRDLWETYLPAFKAAVQKGNVKEVMCAYNRFEGDPCCGSNRLLTQILREKWGYNGLVVSDCGAIDNFYKPERHMTHPDSAHASAAAILSGTDLECGNSYKSVQKAVQLGVINENEINVSLKRLLKARFELGEMDGISPWDTLPDSLINCKKHQELALEMARKSIVLLQNNGILPLNRKYKIALLGPNANDSVMQWGNYNGFPRKTSTMLEALRQEFPNNEIIYNQACNLTESKSSLFGECTANDKTGFSATFWNNVTMSGDPVATQHFTTAIRLGRRDTITKEVNLTNISARFNTVFKPKISGTSEFVFTSISPVKLFIDGLEYKPELITKSLKVLKLEVEAEKSYAIAIEYTRGNEVTDFRLSFQRTANTDYSEILSIVKDADAVIFAGGISANLEREDANVYAPGFKGGDRTNIELPEVQRNIIKELKAAGKKVILVNFSGSAMGLVPESKNCDAIVQAWYPGEAGGKAIVDVLYGNYNPSGKLPITFYKNVDQLPDFENYNLQGHTYRYMKEEPLFSFGYGLSYTTFNYGKLTLSKYQIKALEPVKLTIPVTNTGKYNGEEVVQVYLKKMKDANGPAKTLRAFKRVQIAAGTTVNVPIELTAENLEWWDETSGTMLMHAGTYQIMVGGSSVDSDLKKTEIKIQ